ncbi:hypothetical protein ElyMa_000108200 [Elysia marginata]|uniref:Uncharacterized protein n=1 Tax=Elysia marginata TaxID=1093978 RepID=A0AAV4EKZ3_9GAST|nr:hypothetical protein ElyMa_000108200 [Elysia marginata]
MTLNDENVDVNVDDDDHPGHDDNSNDDNDDVHMDGANYQDDDIIASRRCKPVSLPAARAVIIPGRHS